MGILEDLKEGAIDLVTAFKKAPEVALNWARTNLPRALELIPAAVNLAPKLGSLMRDFASRAGDLGSGIVEAGGKIWSIDASRAIQNIGAQIMDLQEKIATSTAAAYHNLNRDMVGMRQALQQATKDKRQLLEALSAGHLIGDIATIGQIDARSVDLLKLLRDAEKRADEALAFQRDQERMVPPPEKPVVEPILDFLKKNISGGVKALEEGVGAAIDYAGDQMKVAGDTLAKAGVTPENVEKVLNYISIQAPVVVLPDQRKKLLDAGVPDEVIEGISKPGGYDKAVEEYPAVKDVIPFAPRWIFGGGGLYVVPEATAATELARLAPELTTTGAKKIAASSVDDFALEVVKVAKTNPKALTRFVTGLTDDQLINLYTNLGKTTLGKTATPKITTALGHTVETGLGATVLGNIFSSLAKHPKAVLGTAIGVAGTVLGLSSMALWELVDFGVGSSSMAGFKATEMADAREGWKLFKDAKKKGEQMLDLAKKLKWIPIIGPRVTAAGEANIENMDAFEATILARLQYGTLKIACEPIAFVYVDGKVQGHVSRISVDVEKDVPHTVSVSEPGYESEVVEVSPLEGGEVRKISVTLKKLTPGEAENVATLKVTAADAETGEALAADIIVAGGLTGQTAPATFKLPVKTAGTTYSVGASMRGYYTRTESRTLFPGGEAEIHFLLTRKPTETEPTWGGEQENRETERGGLALFTTPSGAFVTVDAIWHPYPTPTKIELEPGTYHIKIEKDGYEPIEDDVTIEAGTETRKEYDLSQIPLPPLWRVDVSTVPTGAKILINDQFIGKWAPDFEILPEGVWKIGVVKAGYFPAEQVIELKVE